MSDYTKIVDYAAKDALITGNPSKLVKGTEIGAEYDAISVAIATKANTASPAFTGVSSFAVGAVGAPSIYMTGYATTGWYNIGANNWGFAVSGAKVLDIASTGLSVTGTLSATGVANFLGESSIGITIRSNGLTTEEFNGIDNILVNYKGYANGTTQFRQFLIYDGKTNQIAAFTNAGLAVTGALSATGTLSTVGLITSTAAAQSALFNNAAGSYATWQYNGTSLGDIGTANQVVSGGSTADFAITSRAGNLILGSGLTTRVTVSSTGLAVTGLLTPTISGTGVYFSGGDSSVSRRLEFSTTTTTNTGDTQKINALGATGVLVLQANSSEIARVSDTGLAVTGTLSASWVFSLTGGSVNPIVVSGATTGESYGKFTNTSGQTVFGVNNSVAGTLYSGGTAYASFFGSNVAKNVDLIVNGATVASLSSTGLAVTGTVSATTTIKTGGYTVATLPAGTVGMRAYVTDATAPTYNGALTGGGAVTVPVFYNGTAWVSA